MIVYCPKCNQKYDVDKEYIGRHAVCEQCNTSFTILDRNSTTKAKLKISEEIELFEQLKILSSKIDTLKDTIKSEEATKHALILPFIEKLGYDIFDPTEVNPEFIADIGTKKNEKIDYAIILDGLPIILIECKSCNSNLDVNNMSQLLRYYHTSKAKFGILTNGIIYKFFSDLEKENVMDQKPFFEINMLDLKKNSVENLKKFKKNSFNIENIISTAEELKYIAEIKKLILNDFENPGDDIVKHYTKLVYPSTVTQNIKKQFKIYVQKAINQIFNEKVNDLLQSAMSDGDKATLSKEQKLNQEKEDLTRDNRIITTQEEIEGYHIVKSILRTVVDPEKVVMRDAISYCAILFDDNNRKPICRMHFNNTENLSIGFFDNDNSDDKIHISSLNDIYNYSDRLINSLKKYL